MRLSHARAVAAALVISATAAAAPPAKDPDWPCVQRLVPRLSAAVYWSGPTRAGDWHADPRVSELLSGIAPRDVPVERGTAAIAAFAAKLPPPERAATLALTFAGLLDETNRQRGQVIDELRALTRRQRGLADVIAHVTGEARALPPDASPETRDEIVQRRAVLIRQFEEADRTTRYACEVPVALEARLGAYARALQDASETAQPAKGD